eukprot:TRINITY_DN8129_c0_g1_i3.p1 TRINITY_DN8129_c0_g1~~TRINITY_DN8129_c0_g1_i3.p1  ORF type:complete len:463 (-),score=68.38 TRINITY_DN8129_c0_g1_i3:119-1471(-)
MGTGCQLRLILGQRSLREEWESEIVEDTKKTRKEGLEEYFQLLERRTNALREIISEVREDSRFNEDDVFRLELFHEIIMRSRLARRMSRFPSSDFEINNRDPAFDVITAPTGLTPADLKKDFLNPMEIYLGRRRYSDTNVLKKTASIIAKSMNVVKPLPKVQPEPSLSLEVTPIRFLRRAEKRGTRRIERSDQQGRMVVPTRSKIRASTRIEVPMDYFVENREIFNNIKAENCGEKSFVRPEVTRPISGALSSDSEIKPRSDSKSILPAKTGTIGQQLTLHVPSNPFSTEEFVHQTEPKDPVTSDTLSGVEKEARVETEPSPQLSPFLPKKHKLSSISAYFPRLSPMMKPSTAFLRQSPVLNELRKVGSGEVWSTTPKERQRVSITEGKTLSKQLPYLTVPRGMAPPNFPSAPKLTSGSQQMATPRVRHKRTLPSHLISPLLNGSPYKLS